MASTNSKIKYEYVLHYHDYYKMLKHSYFKWILAFILLLIILSASIVYIWSGIILNKTYKVPLSGIQVPTDSASLAEGKRLMLIEHCGDCHGEQLKGKVLKKIPFIVQSVAPNLTLIIPGYSNEELMRLIRQGVKKNGKSVFGMPSFMYYELKEESLAKIIAYLRTLKPLESSPGLPASITFFPLGRLRLIQGRIKPIASLIDHDAPRRFANFDTSILAFGRYLTMTACASCHGRKLKGLAGFSPNLIIAAAYNHDQFIHLLKTGQGGLGRKDLGEMSSIAKNHLCYLNDKEMNAIFAFLKTLPTQKD